MLRIKDFFSKRSNQFLLKMAHLFKHFLLVSTLFQQIPLRLYVHPGACPHLRGTDACTSAKQSISQSYSSLLFCRRHKILAKHLLEIFCLSVATMCYLAHWATFAGYASHRVCAQQEPLACSAGGSSPRPERLTCSLQHPRFFWLDKLRPKERWPRPSKG